MICCKSNLSRENRDTHHISDLPTSQLSPPISHEVRNTLRRKRAVPLLNQEGSFLTREPAPGVTNCPHS
jgi:hypothetical protein